MTHAALQRILKALAGGPRLAVIAYLAKHRSASVGEIAEAVHRSHNTASLHLAHLHRLGIVERRHRGSFVFYRLSVPQHPITRAVLKEL